MADNDALVGGHRVFLRATLNTRLDTLPCARCTDGRNCRQPPVGEDRGFGHRPGRGDQGLAGRAGPLRKSCDRCGTLPSLPPLAAFGSPLIPPPLMPRGRHLRAPTTRHHPPPQTLHHRRPWLRHLSRSRSSPRPPKPSARCYHRVGSRHRPMHRLCRSACRTVRLSPPPIASSRRFASPPRPSNFAACVPSSSPPSPSSSIPSDALAKRRTMWSRRKLLTSSPL